MESFKIKVPNGNFLIKQIPKEKTIFWSIIFYLFLFVGSLIFTIIKFASLPPKIPLFYSKPWGQERLANREFIWLLPAILLLLILINTVLAKIFAAKILFLAQIVSITLSILTFLIFVTLLKIIFQIS